MTYPKVTIIWLNYNSRKFIELVLESLDALANIDYPNYEVVIVDNGSNDGSFEIISRFAERKLGSKVKIIKLRKNIGFCGGNNVGFRARDRGTKYVVLLNNDAIPFTDSLTNLVEELEYNTSVGSAQGVIVDYDHGYIDTIGGIMDEFLNTYPLFRGYPAEYVKKSYYITYADGAFSIHKVEAIIKVNGSDRLFDDIGFAYLDDVILGLKIWNSNYKVMAYPFIVAKHRRSSSFGKITRITPLRLYLTVRNRLALIKITNSRYKNIASMKYLLWNCIHSFLVQMKEKRSCREHIRSIIDALRDVEKVARVLKVKQLDLYKAPIVLFSMDRKLLGNIPHYEEYYNYVKNYIKKALLTTFVNALT